MIKKNIPVLLTVIVLISLACLCGNDPHTIILVQATPIPTETPIPTPMPAPAPSTEITTTTFECNLVKYEVTVIGPITTNCVTNDLLGRSTTITLQDGRNYYMEFGEVDGHPTWLLPYQQGTGVLSLNDWSQPTDFFCSGNWAPEKMLTSGIPNDNIAPAVLTPSQITCTNDSVTITALIYHVEYHGRFLWWDY